IPYEMTTLEVITYHDDVSATATKEYHILQYHTS
ncbi:unnamed protein product, partial [Didymodactylos carnosus]